MNLNFVFLAASEFDETNKYRPPRDIRFDGHDSGGRRYSDEDSFERLDDVSDSLRDAPGLTSVSRLDVDRLLVEIKNDESGHDPDIVKAAMIVVAVECSVSLALCRNAHDPDGEILVNATGQPTDVMMWDSQRRATLHVDAESVHDLLSEYHYVDEGGERSYVMSVEPVAPFLSPFPGMGALKVYCTADGTWSITHQRDGRTFITEDPMAHFRDVEELIAVYQGGNERDFYAGSWISAPRERPEPVTFHFFRAQDFDDEPGGFRSQREFIRAAGEFFAYSEKSFSTGSADIEETTPNILRDFADWMNRRAVQAAQDPANPPSDLYMDLSPYPVSPRGRMLTVTVPVAVDVHDDTFADLLMRAATLNLCMIESSGRVWVNATGEKADDQGSASLTNEATAREGLRIGLRGGAVVTSASEVALRSVLETAAIDGVEGFVLSVEPTVHGGVTPVPGIREVQVGIGEQQWIVHYLTMGERFSLVDPGMTVDEVVDVIGLFLSGDKDSFIGQEWENISEGNVPDSSSRWQLTDSVGTLLNVGESEIHIAVPMNYAPELDWFQVADQIDQGNYITADRHLGHQWSVMWGHKFGEENYYRRVVDTREDAEALIHAYIDETEEEFLSRGWEQVDND